MSSREIKASIEALKAAIAKNPQLSNVTMQAVSISDTDSLATRYVIREFEGILDEPPTLAGTNTGPNPVEALLAALGGCQEIVYRAYAAALGLEIERIEVKVRGDLDVRGFLGLAAVPSGLKTVTYTSTIVSPESEARIRELAQLVESHCPVLDTLQRQIEVRGTVNVIFATQSTSATPLTVAG